MSDRITGQTTNSPDDKQTDMTIGLELPRLLERMLRRYLDAVAPLLEKAGAGAISPAQYMMLQYIGPTDLSVREVLERGYYHGSNASYNLKQLVESGYVERTASLRDKRAARVKLTQQGTDLLQSMREHEKFAISTLYEVMGGGEALEVTYKTLRQLENRWREMQQAESAAMLHFME